MLALHMPNLQSPIAGDNAIAPIWARYIREIHTAIMAELSPGRISPFYLSASDLIDPTQFVQSGATSGLGVGSRIGWAICNGNNGTPNLDGKFPRFDLSAPAVSGGSDSSAHTHSIGHDHPAVTTSDGGSHSHESGSLQADIDPGASNIILWRSGASGFTSDNRESFAKTSSSFSGTTSYSVAVSGSTASTAAHNHTADVSSFTGDSGTSSGTENRPAFYNLVPLMRV